MLEMHTRQSDRSVKVAVGVMMLCSVFAVLLLVWVNATHINPLAETYNLNVAMNHGQGIQEGAPVTLVGIPVGKVERISLGSEGKVKMSLQVLKAYQPNIREDSVIFLIQPMVGVSKLDISLGSDSTRQLEDGDQLRFRKQAVFDEILETIPPKMLVLDTILDNLNTLTKQLARSEGPFQSSLKSISVTSRNFEELSSESLAVVDQVKNIVDDMDNISQQGVEVVGHFKNSSEQVPELIKQLEAILLDLSAIANSMKNISQHVERSRSEIPELVTKGRHAETEADEILRALKTTPFLSPAFKKQPDNRVVLTPRDE